MKKIIAAVLSLTLVATLFVGCEKESALPTLGEDELLTYSDYIAKFKETIAEKSDYTVELKDETALNDEYDGHMFHIKSAKADKTFELRLYVNKEGKTEWVFLFADDDSKGKEQFAEVSHILYEAAGLPPLSRKAFNKKFKLLSTEDLLETDSYGKYDIISMTMSSSDQITFSIRSTDSYN